MRVAFAGKGGSGKSTIVGTFARLLAAAGEPTLVLDSDVMPGLAGALGVPATDAPIPDEAIVENPEGTQPRWRLRDGLDAAAAVEQYALRGPDDVRLLQIGKLRTDGAWTISPSLHAFDAIKQGLPRDRWHLVGDLPGGTRQPFMGWADFADLLVVVVEPTQKGVLTARRFARRAHEPGAPRPIVVANKVEGDDDVARVEAGTDLDVVAAVPADPAVRDADERGLALVDHAPDGPAVDAVRRLVAVVTELAA